jgi:uncharacterized protein (TIGR00369 family)
LLFFASFLLVLGLACRIAWKGVPTPNGREQGRLRAGPAATLLDSACGIATHSALGAGRGHTTLELKVSYLRGLSEDSGTVRATGRVVSIGKRVAFAEATLHDGAGRCVCDGLLDAARLRTSNRAGVAHCRNEGLHRRCSQGANTHRPFSADEPSRAVMSRHIDDFVSQTIDPLAGRDEGDPLLAVSAMAGGVVGCPVFRWTPSSQMHC